jgi:hypothetical protein
MRVNRGQKFVIGGYTPSDRNFGALVIGYYKGRKRMYAARTLGRGIDGEMAECR